MNQLFTVGLAIGVAPVSAAEVTLVVSPAVVVREVSENRDVISGLLVNNSSRVVREVRLLIRHHWLWNRERSPGANSPGRAVYRIVRHEIVPGGTIIFNYRPDPSLPVRSDGHFETAVEVAGYTEIGDE